MTMTVNPLASIRELYGSPARPRPPAPPRPPSSEAAHALRMANSLTNGLISYSLGVPRTAPAPANLRADAVTGIVWAPSIFGVLLPFFGVAQINASIALTSMIGKATSVHSGSAESDGGIGWLVVELNQQGTFNGLSLSTWTDQYDLAVSGGQAQNAQIANPAFTQSASFITRPECFYEIYV